MTPPTPSASLSPSPGWKSRIVGSGDEDPEQLLANPRNWRIHPKAQQEALSGLLDKVGWVQNVVVNQRTGHLVDGHLRVSLALRREEPTIPVVYVDLSPEEEALVLATIDPLGDLAATDREQLAELLGEVGREDLGVGLSVLLDDLGDLPVQPGKGLVDVQLEAAAGRIGYLELYLTEDEMALVREVLDAQLGSTDSERLVALCRNHGRA